MSTHLEHELMNQMYQEVVKVGLKRAVGLASQEDVDDMQNRLDRALEAAKKDKEALSESINQRTL